VKKKWGTAMQRQRKFLGMSQEELAAALGVKQSTVSRWESGDAAPTLENQLAIARVLRIDARVLFSFPDAA
jgi:transcriptional regulator with XRE-family HTH domain